MVPFCFSNFTHRMSSPGIPLAINTQDALNETHYCLQWSSLDAGKWWHKDLNPGSLMLRFTHLNHYSILDCPVGQPLHISASKSSLILSVPYLSSAWRINRDWTPSPWNLASTEENILSGKQMVQHVSQRENEMWFLRSQFCFRGCFVSCRNSQMSSQLLTSARSFFHSWTFHRLLIYTCSLQIVTEQSA